METPSHSDNPPITQPLPAVATPSLGVLPPHSTEAEQAVLGALLIDQTVFENIIGLVSSEDFYHDHHRRIFLCVEWLSREGRPLDVLTIAEGLEGKDYLQPHQKNKKTNDSALTTQAIDVLPYLGELAKNTPSVANVVRYAEIVRNRSILRKLISKSNAFIEEALHLGSGDARTLLDKIESEIFDINESANRATREFQAMDEVMTKVSEHITLLYNKKDPHDITGLSTGFLDIDNMTSGFHKGELIIIAGRPSMGKTSFAMNIAEHVALNEGGPVGIFSLEMSAEQIGQRMLGSVGRINQQKMRTGRLSDDEWFRVGDTLTKLNEAQIYIDDQPSINVFELRARARRLFRKIGRIELIIVDYLQLMSGSGRNSDENRAQEVSEISRALKGLARELDVPVIALSQLNRSVESRKERRPQMSDLRESGSIEQDADVIFFIYRDEVYDKESSKKGIAEINIGKQRNGPIGTVEVTFLGEYTRFENFSSSYHKAPLLGKTNAAADTDDPSVF